MVAGNALLYIESNNKENIFVKKGKTRGRILKIRDAVDCFETKIFYYLIGIYVNKPAFE